MKVRGASVKVVGKGTGDLCLPKEIVDSLCSCGGVEGLIKQLPPDEVFDKMRDWYQACADPARLKILALLMVQPLCVCIIKSVVKIADSRLSYHLTILKKAGMIEGEQQGLYIIYQITPAAQAFIRNEFRRFGYTLPRKSGRM
ncbi:MAG: DNA-binding transcriptional repressor ArsR [Methanoregulaceae archaeon PtaB.Bin056]|jgi:ArsR family transcriptional regulator|nr:MAG: DNA-binding transcriptional repressor ArsR [Methanoregulaceae archaeon PtaB.Bin056]